MAEINVPRKSPIRVKKKPDHVEVKIKLSTKHAPHPKKGVNNPNGYDLFWMLADVYVVDKEYEEGYFLEQYQVDEFVKGDEVELIADVPHYVADHPKLDKSTLRLIFYKESDDQWYEFVDAAPPEGATTFEVKIPLEWIKDPPVGWGGNHPTA